MKVLGFDPGATRCGWACISLDAENKDVIEHGSGVFGLKRNYNGSKAEPYQEYRLRLIDFWIRNGKHLLNDYQPDVVIGETVPPTGTGNVAGNIQRTLAATSFTVVVVLARQDSVAVEQIGATSVKTRIGGSKKASKVAVRNGVYKIVPATERFHKEWVSIFDRSDAYAVALCKLGFRVRDGRVKRT